VICCILIRRIVLYCQSTFVNLPTFGLNTTSHDTQNCPKKLYRKKVQTPSRANMRTAPSWDTATLTHLRTFGGTARKSRNPWNEVCSKHMIELPKRSFTNDRKGANPNTTVFGKMVMHKSWQSLTRFYSSLSLTSL